jgi:multiple sugar transport system ATP-binding protein
MAEVRLKGIIKRFGGNEILKNIDLTIHDGEFFTLVGPSGCGKSTLLHLIAGLETLTEGQIYFDGHEISHLPPKDRDVALVFQSYALYPHMSVFENLAFPLRMKKQPSAEIDLQVRKVAELLGLTLVLSHKPQALSGGQRQRVALGRAIVRQPRVFLLDEPLSNLDAQLRIEMRSELKKLHQSLKVTMIYVTHDQAEAMTLSERMAVLHQGIIQQCGTPKEIYDRPSNVFVAGFIGSPPMNLLNGSITVDPPGAIHLGESTFGELSIETIDRIRASIATDRILLGIRPEHVRSSRVKGPKAIAAQVFLVEPMGSEVWLEAVWTGYKLRVKAPVDFDPKIGETVYLEMDEEKVQFFDVETGKRIS